MSRTSRRRIRAAATRVDATEVPGLARAAARMDACQRMRTAHHVLALLPPDVRREVLARHGLPAPVVEVVASRLDPAYDRPAVRLRMLRRDVP